MSVTDIILIAGAIVAACWGAWRGFIPQLGSFVAILLGIVACQLFGAKAAAMLSLPLIAADILLFIAVYLAVTLLSRVIHRTARALLLGPVDRLAGGAFGIVKWLILASLLLNVWLAFDPASAIARGRLTPAVVRIVPRLLGYVSDYINHAG